MKEKTNDSDNSNIKDEGNTNTITELPGNSQEPQEPQESQESQESDEQKKENNDSTSTGTEADIVTTPPKTAEEDEPVLEDDPEDENEKEEISPIKLPEKGAPIQSSEKNNVQISE